MSGREAFKSFIRSYDAHQLKTIFSLRSLDLKTVAKSFGFITPPGIDLSESQHFIIANFFSSLILTKPKFSLFFSSPSHSSSHKQKCHTNSKSLNDDRATAATDTI